MTTCRGILFRNLRLLKSMTCDMTEITSEQDRLAGELAIITQQIEGLLRENATVALTKKNTQGKKIALLIGSF